MRTSDIKAFLALEKFKDIGITAQNLNTSVNAINKQLARLEKELDVSLFSVDGTKYSLSDYGLELLPYARQLTSLEDAFSSDLINGINTKHQLKVGYTFSLAPYTLKNFIFNFQKDNAFVNTFAYTDCSNVLTKQVLTGECDIAFVLNTSGESNPLLKTIPVSRSQLYAVVYSSHPLFNYSTLSIEQLDGEPLFTAPIGSAVYRLCENEFHDLELSPNIKFTSPNIEDITSLVAREFGIGIVTGEDIQYRTRDNIRFIKINSSAKSVIEMIYRKDSTSPSIYYFLTSISKLLQ